MRRLSLLFPTLLPVAAWAQNVPAPDAYAAGRAVVPDIHRVVTPDGVQENFEAVLGGARQVVNVRGADRRNPILLFVHGGPGAVEMPMAWAFQRPWEDYFTVAIRVSRENDTSASCGNIVAMVKALPALHVRMSAAE